MNSRSTCAAVRSLALHAEMKSERNASVTRMRKPTSPMVSFFGYTLCIQSVHMLSTKSGIKTAPSGCFSREPDRIPEDQHVVHVAGSPIGKALGCRTRSCGPPWGRLLMPKAPFFSHHFDWTAIGDSETIVPTLVQVACHPWVARRGRRRQAR